MYQFRHYFLKDDAELSHLFNIKLPKKIISRLGLIHTEADYSFKKYCKSLKDDVLSEDFYHKVKQMQTKTNISQKGAAVIFSRDIYNALTSGRMPLDLHIKLYYTALKIHIDKENLVNSYKKKKMKQSKDKSTFKRKRSLLDRIFGFRSPLEQQLSFMQVLLAIFKKILIKLGFIRIYYADDERNVEKRQKRGRQKDIQDLSKQEILGGLRGKQISSNDVSFITNFLNRSNKSTKEIIKERVEYYFGDVHYYTNMKKSNYYNSFLLEKFK